MAITLPAVLLAGCSGASSARGEVDTRVVNAVVTAPGEGAYADPVWLREQLRATVMPEIEGCLEDVGRADAIPKAADYVAYYEEMNEFAFPDPDRYRRGGVRPVGTIDGIPDTELSANDATLECYFSVTKRQRHKAVSLSESLHSEWTMKVELNADVSRLPDEFATFEACLSDKTGFPGGSADAGTPPSVYDFLDWWPHQYGGEDVMPDEKNLEGGEIFANCLAPLTKAQAELVADDRAEFIEQHHEDLAVIADAIED
ncbi:MULTISPECIES: hypothetical protein [unclassified Brachybacterium]|uniref:hypothetical protein n=1 Tax=unclassified Brachybacterium TaxID=2623841 RepID=UPI000C7FC855|nr:MULTISPECIES: hypothetical protein [unclassified Brachybacterium]PMC76497.1 hypothetical protein CJ197_01685 [Brachybacterium sp. UMB0905]